MLDLAWIVAYILFPFLGATTVAALIVRYKHLHAKATADYDLTGIQKFHTVPVPRVGGIPVAFAMLMGLLLMLINQTPGHERLLAQYRCLICAGSIAFFVGLIEDITKKIGALPRLCVTFIAAGFAAYWLSIRIDRMDIPMIDFFLNTHSWASILLGIFVVGGVSHAFNIIDGYNGLASGASLIVLIALFIVASKVGDVAIALSCCVLIGGISGFLLFNFPHGKLFLGDGGAYFIGFMIAVLSIRLGNQHASVVSPWFPMLLVIYPVFETVFSMYRRKVQGKSVGLPDRGHLHQLIFLRLVRWRTTSQAYHDRLFRNSLTSPYLWCLTTAAVIPAVLCYGSTLWLSLFILLFIFSYLWLYKRIVHFRTPRWMVLSIPDHE
jgi:UDP-GlcNAc:undecaprenyl-phosphate/decaprenyl-phosphate GlcNAc-1-phosphate transferase